MNVNKALMTIEDVVKIPVAPDIYDGDKNKWITFTYADERPALFADDEEQFTEVTINVSYFCPANHNYFSDKKKIKSALVSLGFNLEYIQNFIDTAENGVDRLRHIVFVVNYTGIDA